MLPLGVHQNTPVLAIEIAVGADMYQDADEVVSPGSDIGIFDSCFRDDRDILSAEVTSAPIPSGTYLEMFISTNEMMVNIPST